MQELEKMTAQVEVRNAKKMSKEKWEKLTLANGFIFSKVMLNEEICKKMIEELTDLPPIDYIEYIEAEKTIDLRVDSKSVRLDVYVQDGKGTVYNIEMQAVDTKELRERSRYYQSVIDLDLIDKGEDYINISDSYVIFISQDDIFNRGLIRYTFKNRCMELDDLALEDGTTKIFLNSKGTIGKISEDARSFLSYLEGQKSNNQFVKLLEKEVSKVKSNKKWRAEYVKQNVHDMLNIRKGIELGIEQGIERGIERGIEQGAYEKAVEVAKKLLSSDVSKEIIAEVSGLPLEAIESLEAK